MMLDKLSGGALFKSYWKTNNSINVVGNIWEPEKFKDIHNIQRQVNAYAIA